MIFIDGFCYHFFWFLRLSTAVKIKADFICKLISRFLFFAGPSTWRKLSYWWFSRSSTVTFFIAKLHIIYLVVCAKVNKINDNNFSLLKCEQKNETASGKYSSAELNVNINLLGDLTMKLNCMMKTYDSKA